MSLLSKESLIGRMAQVKSYVKSHAYAPVGAYSVILEVFEDPPDVPPEASDGRASRGANSAKRSCNIIFYDQRGPAWLDSAKVLGKLPGEKSDVTAARRNKALSGKIHKVSLNAMGRMGIGAVEGERNLKGAPKVVSAGSKAKAVVSTALNILVTAALTMGVMVIP